MNRVLEPWLAGGDGNVRAFLLTAFELMGRYWKKCGLVKPLPVSAVNKVNAVNSVNMVSSWNYRNRRKIGDLFKPNGDNTRPVWPQCYLRLKRYLIGIAARNVLRIALPAANPPDTPSAHHKI